MIVIFIDWLTKPKPIQRSENEQLEVQAKADNLSLYQLHACPFCVKTRRAIHELNVKIDLKDINESENRQALESGGGKTTVPCLRIDDEGEVKWLYESNDIIRYLRVLAGVENQERLAA